MKPRNRKLLGLGCSLGLLLMPAVAQAQVAPPVQAPSGPVPAPVQAPVPALGEGLVIGVDHLDVANQANMDNTHRLFEYTDFFSRSVTVHSGDVLDFRFAPGSNHTVALASDETAARKAYPVGGLDSDDPIKAIGSGGAKITQGPGQQSIANGVVGEPNSPPTCGVTAMGQAPCAFRGGSDIENTGIVGAFDPKTGQPTPLDWKITINATPGAYTFFCYIHPGMRGNLTVVPAGQAATTQAQIDAASSQQFADDQASALAAEKAANSITYSGGAPGTRTYQVQVGISAANNHVAIDEMLPNQPLQLVAGDQVKYLWNDPHNVHTVTFAADMTKAPEAFGFDCGSTYQPVPSGPPAAGQPAFVPCTDPVEKAPELIGDPGNAPSGTALADPNTLVDSGFLAGTNYGIVSTSPSWAVTVNNSSKAGNYVWFCTVHDWMHGSLTVGS